jgi:malate dehydrogenase
MYVGVPTLIGAGGTEKVIEFDMNDAEQSLFNASVEAVQGLIETCKGIDGTLA